MNSRSDSGNSLLPPEDTKRDRKEHVRLKRKQDYLTIKHGAEGIDDFSFFLNPSLKKKIKNTSVATMEQ